MTEGNDIYYRVKLDSTVCELQWFDEHDYDASQWAKDEDGDPLTFKTEAGAEAYADLLRRPIISAVPQTTDGERWIRLRIFASTDGIRCADRCPKLSPNSDSCREFGSLGASHREGGHQFFYRHPACIVAEWPTNEGTKS